MVSIQSTQEEADTLLILYAVAVTHQGNTVHIYSCDTDMLVLALRRVLDLKPDSVIIMWALEIDDDKSNSSPSMLL